MTFKSGIDASDIGGIYDCSMYISTPSTDTDAQPGYSILRLSDPKALKQVHAINANRSGLCFK